MTVLTVRLADWIVILALILNVACTSVICVMELRRIRKRKPVRVELQSSDYLRIVELATPVRLLPHVASPDDNDLCPGSNQPSSPDGMCWRCGMLVAAVPKRSDGSAR